MNCSVRTATLADLDDIKRLCDAHRVELGFVMRPSLTAAIEHEEVLVALQEDRSFSGFVHFHHRRDMQTTVYHIAVLPAARGLGIGRELIQALASQCTARGKSHILLKCPEELKANAFYAHVGFTKVDVEAGKSRSLNVWKYVVDDAAGEVVVNRSTPTTI